MGTDMHGAVGWFEIGTDDPAGAEAFYGALLGWSFVADAPGYQQIATHGGPRQSGGIMDTGADRPAYATICVRVADTAATSARAQELGGRVVAGPMALGDGMQVAYLLDREGALVCVWTPDGEEEPAPFGEEPGAVGWFDIGATDVDAAVEFYADLFGWGAEPVPDPTSDYRLVTTGDGHRLHGAIGSRHGGPYAIFDVSVPDVEAACAHAEQLGGKVVVPPRRSAVGPTYAHLLDPSGNRFGVYTPRPA